MTYMVQYYNGVGSREKYFTTIEEAKSFQQTCGDLTATIWKLWEEN